jgi:hypothetical protein
MHQRALAGKFACLNTGLSQPRGAEPRIVGRGSARGEEMSGSDGSDVAQSMHLLRVRRKHPRLEPRGKILHPPGR